MEINHHSEKILELQEIYRKLPICLRQKMSQAANKELSAVRKILYNKLKSDSINYTYDSLFLTLGNDPPIQKETLYNEVKRIENFIYGFLCEDKYNCGELKAIHYLQCAKIHLSHRSNEIAERFLQKAKKEIDMICYSSANQYNYDYCRLMLKIIANDRDVKKYQEQIQKNSDLLLFNSKIHQYCKVVYGRMQSKNGIDNDWLKSMKDSDVFLCCPETIFFLDIRLYLFYFQQSINFLSGNSEVANQLKIKFVQLYNEHKVDFNKECGTLFMNEIDTLLKSKVF